MGTDFDFIVAVVVVVVVVVSGWLVCIWKKEKWLLLLL